MKTQRNTPGVYIIGGKEVTVKYKPAKLRPNKYIPHNGTKEKTKRATNAVV